MLHYQSTISHVNHDTDSWPTTEGWAQLNSIYIRNHIREWRPASDMEAFRQWPISDRVQAIFLIKSEPYRFIFQENINEQRM